MKEWKNKIEDKFPKLFPFRFIKLNQEFKVKDYNICVFKKKIQ